MIERPKRAVTRFFVPLIDVLILLFCIFLLMPFVATEPKPETEEPKDQVKAAEPELPRDVRELQAELQRDEMRPQWRHFWNVTLDAYGPEWRLPADPISLLRRRCTISQGSIFNLPERTWDAATMFFCAESITERQNEFEAACASFARCVKPGGALIAAFLVRSSGYEVAGRKFPVLGLSAESIESTFTALAVKVKAERIGIVPREIRSGYSGFVLLTGTAA